MNFTQIFSIVKSGEFSDGKGNWQVSSADLAVLQPGQVHSLKWAAEERKSYFEKLAAAQESAEKAGKKYTPPAGVPDLIFRNQVYEYERFLDQLSVKVSKADLAFQAPKLAKTWIPALKDGFIFDGAKVTRICNAMKSMIPEIEAVVLSKLSGLDMTFISNDNEKVVNGSLVKCGAGEHCGLSANDRSNGRKYGYVSTDVLHSLKSQSTPTGTKEDIAKTWDRRIVKAIRDTGSILPIKIAHGLLTLGPVPLPSLPKSADAAARKRRQDDADAAMQKAREKFKASLDAIDKAIFKGISVAQQQQVGGTPSWDGSSYFANAAFSWIMAQSSSTDSLYFHYKDYISSSSCGIWQCW